MTGQHYFTAAPEVGSAPVPVTVSLPDVTLTLTSDRGVFSVGELDNGTEFLLRAAPDPPASGAILDIGCGWGPIAVVMALRSPSAQVWAIDINERALELTRTNAAAARAANVIASTPDSVPEDLTFDAIYANPPVRIGKDALHALLLRWLRRLTAQGHCILVVQRHLGADSLAQWLVDEGYAVTRLRSRQGYRLLEVRPRH